MNPYSKTFFLVEQLGLVSRNEKCKMQGSKKYILPQSSRSIRNFDPEEFQENLYFNPDKNYAKKLYQELIRRLQLLIRNEISLIRMTEIGRIVKVKVLSFTRSLHYCWVQCWFHTDVLLWQRCRYAAVWCDDDSLINIICEEHRYYRLRIEFICDVDENIKISITLSVFKKSAECY